MNAADSDRRLVVCCHCCRVENGGWVPLDPWFAPGDRAVAHVVCPTCVTEHYSRPGGTDSVSNTAA